MPEYLNNTYDVYCYCYCLTTCKTRFHSLSKYSTCMLIVSFCKITTCKMSKTTPFFSTGMYALHILK